LTAESEAQRSKDVDGLARMDDILGGDRLDCLDDFFMGDWQDIMEGCIIYIKMIGGQK
jgi:hypothetical protein